MAVRAWEFGDHRFVGIGSQWEVFRAANGIVGRFVEHAATDDERAVWRKDRGGWFLRPAWPCDKDEYLGQVDTDGDLNRAEVSTCHRCVSIVRNPCGDNQETLVVLDPDAAEAMARCLMRSAKEARALRAISAQLDAVDETQWENTP